MIEIKNLTKSYKNGLDKSSVLNDISLNIREGEFIAIVGQSGSGKSTLLSIIGGLTKATCGEFKYKDKDINKFKDRALSKYRRETVGFVFQDFNLEGNETVLENIMSPMLFAKIPVLERKKRAIEVLEKVNLKDKINSKTNELSGGQKQRVAIARALINKPKIILADEPTGNLDSKNSADIMGLLKELNSQGYTVILVTHSIEQSYMANRIIKLKDGKIVQEINTSEELSLNLIKEESRQENLNTEMRLKQLLEILEDKDIESLFVNYILNGSNINTIKKKIKEEINELEKEI